MRKIKNRNIIILFVISFIFITAFSTFTVFSDSEGLDLTPLFNQASTADEDQSMIIEIMTPEHQLVEQLSNMGIDIAEVKSDSVISVCKSQDLESIKSAGFQYQIIYNSYIEYLQTKVERGGTLSKYHTFQQFEAGLKEMAQKYPNIAELSIIGKSHQNRPIYALRISSSKEKKPTSLFVGLHHAREWIAAEVPYALAKELTSKYQQDSRITDLVNNCTIWVVPVLNPDGLVYSQTQGDWRKNRRNNGGTYGVDLNRNYDFHWGGAGSSSNSGSETYRGPSPNSEPCTQTIAALADRERFRTSISFHSYSNLVLYPYGFDTSSKTPDHDLLNRLAVDMAAFNGYKPMKSSGLYPVGGDSDDYFYAKKGILPFTFELGSEFVPNNNLVDEICRKNIQASLYLIEKSKTVHAKNHPDFQEPPIPVDNLALKKPVKASSVMTSYDPPLAVDGDQSSRWVPQTKNGSWLYVNLEKQTKLSKVKIMWSTTNYPKVYDVQYWDGASWKTFKTVNSDGAWDEFTVPENSVTASYIRVLSKEVSSQYIVLYELEIYGTQSGILNTSETIPAE